MASLHIGMGAQALSLMENVWLRKCALSMTTIEAGHVVVEFFGTFISGHLISLDLFYEIR
jgi:hypothetical protein